MANSVFENALSTIRQAVASVEAEVMRQSSVEVRAQGAQQHLDALRVQQREMQETLHELATKITDSRQVIADAQSKAKALIDNGERQKDRIIAAAEQQASSIREQAQRDGVMIVQDAVRDSELYLKRVADAKHELASIKSQVDAITKQIDAAKDSFSQMTKSAASFASQHVG